MTIADRSRHEAPYLRNPLIDTIKVKISSEMFITMVLWKKFFWASTQFGFWVLTQNLAKSVREMWRQKLCPYRRCHNEQMFHVSFRVSGDFSVTEMVLGRSEVLQMEQEEAKSAWIMQLLGNLIGHKSHFFVKASNNSEKSANREVLHIEQSQTLQMLPKFLCFFQISHFSVVARGQIKHCPFLSSPLEYVCTQN